MNIQHWTSAVQETTFVLLLDFLVACALPQVRQDLRQFADDYVIGGECRLSLRNKNSSLTTHLKQAEENRSGVCLCNPNRLPQC